MSLKIDKAISLSVKEYERVLSGKEFILVRTLSSNVTNVTCPHTADVEVGGCVVGKMSFGPAFKIGKSVGHRMYSFDKYEHSVHVKHVGKIDDYLDSYIIRKIELIDGYDPVEVTDKALYEDFRITLDWMVSWNQDEKSVKFSRPQILKVLVSIIEEIVRRGPTVGKFNFSEMTPAGFSSFDAAIRFGNITIPDEMVVSDEQKLAKSSLKVPLWKRNEERVVGAAVLIPNIVDLQGDIYDGDAVRAAAYYFMEHYRQDDKHGIDVMHNGKVVPDAIKVVQSFVIDADMTFESDLPSANKDHISQKKQTIDYPKDTWIMYARVLSDELWNAVKSGELTGWSIAGFARSRAIDESGS